MDDYMNEVTVEDLGLIFATVEDLAILADDLTTEYFDIGNTDTTEGKRAILWEFKRARANMNAVLQLAVIARDQLKKLGASR